MNKMIDMITTAYITVYGYEKWNNLSDQQKHDVIMTITKDALTALDNIH